MRAHQVSNRHAAASRSASAGRRAEVDPGQPVTAASLMAVQRIAGNRAADWLVQRQTGSQGGSQAGESTEGDQVRAALRSGGAPLDASFRARAESFFRADLSNVRVHTDTVAGDSARAIGAHAYASGSHVVFAPGMYDTSSAAGQHRLAHELAHVVQQRRGPVDGTVGASGVSISDPADRFERAAEQTATRFLSSRGTADRHGGTDIQRDPDVAPTVGDGVLQRDVGFEFETSWQLRHQGDRREMKQWKKGMRKEAELERKKRKEQEKSWKALKGFTGELTRTEPKSAKLKEKEEASEGEDSPRIPEQLPEQEQERKLPGADLAKNDRVLLGTGFDLTADTTPGGGAEIEFVTVAFPESPDGRRGLDGAMLGMTKIAGKLAEMGGKKSIPIGKLSKFGQIPGPFADVLVFPYGPLTANPQSTAGLRLDRLPALVDVMLGGQPESVADPERVGGSLLSADIEVVREARERSAKACAGLDGGLPDKLRAGIEGLLTMVLSYLLMGHKKYEYRGVTGPLSVSKSIAPLMARTNFAVMFRQVFPDHAAFRTVFQDLPTWVQFVLDAAGLSEGPVFEHGFYKTELVGGNKVEVLVQPGQIDLDRGAWLRVLPFGVDLLTKDMSPLVHKSLGNLARGEQVGPERARTEGAIIELRRMTGTVPIDRWRPLALGVCDLVASLRNPSEPVRH